MEYISPYNDINATYGEVAAALKKLGLQDVSTSEHFRFVNEAYKADIKLPARPLDTPFLKGNMIGYSSAILAIKLYTNTKAFFACFW